MASLPGRLAWAEASGFPASLSGRFPLFSFVQQHLPGCLTEAVCPHSAPMPTLTRATHPRHTLVSLRRRPGPLQLLLLSPPSLPPVTHQQPALASQAQRASAPIQTWPLQCPSWGFRPLQGVGGQGSRIPASVRRAGSKSHPSEPLARGGRQGLLFLFQSSHGPTRGPCLEEE